MGHPVNEKCGGKNWLKMLKMLTMFVRLVYKCMYRYLQVFMSACMWLCLLHLLRQVGMKYD